jgi:hypothetical protein
MIYEFLKAKMKKNELFMENRKKDAIKEVISKLESLMKKVKNNKVKYVVIIEDNDEGNSAELFTISCSKFDLGSAMGLMDVLKKSIMKAINKGSKYEKT